MAVDQPGSGVLQSLVMHEAASWLEQLHSEDLAEFEFDQWLRWLNASESHLQTYWLMQELWQLLEPLTLMDGAET